MDEAALQRPLRIRGDALLDEEIEGIAERHVTIHPGAVGERLPHPGDPGAFPAEDAWGTLWLWHSDEPEAHLAYIVGQRASERLALGVTRGIGRNIRFPGHLPRPGRRGQRLHLA